MKQNPLTFLIKIYKESLILSINVIKYTVDFSDSTVIFSNF